MRILTVDDSSVARRLVRNELEPAGYEVHEAAANAIVTKPGIAPGLTAGRVADILFALLSTEIFLLFVEVRDWSPEEWERWTLDTLRAQLCA